MTTDGRRSSNPERRWLLLSHVLFGVTLGVPTVIAMTSGSLAARATTLAIALAAAAWYAALYARPRLQSRVGVMVVYAAGALVFYTVLNVRHPAYILLLYGLLPQFFSTLPRILAVLGTVGIVVLPATARGELTELFTDSDGLFSLLATVGLGLVVTAVIEALGRQTEEQKATIDQLEAARAEIEHLLAAARRDLREREALARTGHALIAARTPDDVVAALAEELADHSTRVRGAALLTTSRDASHEALVLESVAGTAGPLPGTRVLLPGWWAPGEVTVLTPDDLVDTSLLDTITAAPTIALLPTVVAGTAATATTPPELLAVEPVADLLWLTLDARELTPGMRRDLSTVATETALALAGLRLASHAAAQGRMAGVLAERQRLAHEIHDTLAQGFTSIVTQLEAAEQSLGDGTPRAAAHLERAKRMARDSLGEARRTVEALRPEPLDHVTLPAALEDLAARWRDSRPTAPSVAVTIDGEPARLAPAVDDALLRVAQEALTNIGRHAGARHVDLTLSYVDNLVVLDIQDDGVGFDVDAIGDRADVSHGGYGFISMRERITLLGGTLAVESAVGDGTTIAATVPRRPPAAVSGPKEQA